MSPVALSLGVFVCVFGGVLLGMFLRTALPQDHLSADSKGAVNLGIGMIGTMAALVLGLLVASAWSYHSSQKDELTTVSAKFVVLDRLLAHYGPEAQATRAQLRSKVAEILDRVFPDESSSRAPRPPSAGAEVLYDEIQELSPHNDAQSSIKASA